MSIPGMEYAKLSIFKLRRFGKFLLFGLAAVAIDFFGTEFLFAMGVAPLFAKGGGYLAAFLVNLFLVGPIVFRLNNTLSRVLRTGFIYSGTGLVNLSVFHVALTILPSRFPAFLLATVSSAILNYLLLLLLTRGSTSGELVPQ